MEFMTKEDRENLLTEYKYMHDDNWQRGQGIWLVSSILITGSLIVAFQSTMVGFPAPAVSLLLVVIAGIIQVTAGHVTSLTYEKMKEIRQKLGMTETEELYRSKIAGKWWHIIRINAAYALFILLTGVYLFLLTKDFYFSLIVCSIGFIALFVKETFSHLKRAIEKSRN